MRPRPKKPVISGEWQVLLTKDQLPSRHINCGQVVDHCFFRDPTGTWQAWVQVRETEAGRVFTRWEQEGAFHDTPWTPCGVCWQADHRVGESVGTPLSEDVIQAPYVLRDGSDYILVYGGGPVEPSDKTRQVCMARSMDGVSFTRERNANGFSRIAVGPRHSTDAFLLKNAGEYYLYVGTSHFETDGARAAVTLRRSRDLHNWSEPKVVHAGGTCGTHTHSSQSVFVCSLDGYFYLFKMGWSGDERTAAYRSFEPEDFGRGDQKLVAVLEVSAPEIVNSDDQWYISGLILPDYSGIKIATLEWIEDVEQRVLGDGLEPAPDGNVS